MTSPLKCKKLLKPWWLEYDEFLDFLLFSEYDQFPDFLPFSEYDEFPGFLLFSEYDKIEQPSASSSSS